MSLSLGAAPVKTGVHPAGLTVVYVIRDEQAMHAKSATLCEKAECPMGVLWAEADLGMGASARRLVGVSRRIEAKERCCCECFRLSGG